MQWILRCLIHGVLITENVGMSAKVLDMFGDLFVSFQH